MAKKKRTEEIDYSMHHVIQRAQERYGVILTEKNAKEMDARLKSSIASGNRMLGKDAETEIYELEYDGVFYICVYNPSQDKLTTLLPPGTRIKMRK